MLKSKRFLSRIGQNVDHILCWEFKKSICILGSQNLCFSPFKTFRNQISYPGILSLKLGQLTDSDWYVLFGKGTMIKYKLPQATSFKSTPANGFFFSITLLEFSRASRLQTRKEMEVLCQATETKCTDEISSPSAYTETKTTP